MDPEHDQVAEIAERLASPVPGLLLLRYINGRVLDLVERRARSHPSAPRIERLVYRLGTEEASRSNALSTVERIRELARAKPAPAILLTPEVPDHTLSPASASPAAVDPGHFWKQLNSLRELLGAIDARMLICLDPAQSRYATYFAKDLLDWCAPKFNLQGLGLPFDSLLETALELEPRDSQVRGRRGDEDRIRRDSLTALWNARVRSGQPLTVADAERLGLPALEQSLLANDLSGARSIASALEGLALPAGASLGLFLGLKGQLMLALGDVSAALDLLGSAHTNFSLELERRPSSPAAARDVAVSFERLGDLFFRRHLPGDQERALESYLQSLTILKRLFSEHPESFQAARDLSAIHGRLGEFFIRRGSAGDPERAIENFEHSLKHCERLMAEEPQSPEVARDCMLAMSRLAAVVGNETGDIERSLQLQRRSLEIAQMLSDLAPGWSAKHDLMMAHFHTFVRALIAREGELAIDSLRSCQRLMAELDTEGAEIDQTMREMVKEFAAGLSDQGGPLGDGGDHG